MMTLSKRNRRYIELAKREAYKSSYKRFRHGAVLVRGGSVINTSANHNDYCSFARRFRTEPGCSTIHAEIGSILGVDRSQTEGSIVYVARLNKKGEVKLSRPCSMCVNTLRFVGIKKVIYTVDENTIKSMRL